MANDLDCALCLYENDGRRPATAITISNGHAMCAGHFNNSKEWLSTSSGGLGLAALMRRLQTDL